MKRFNLFSCLLSAAVLSTSLISCEKDDKEPLTGLVGAITEDKTLNSSEVYNLTGSLIVEEGATLTIPAGTKIVADSKGTDVYIAVMMGGKIDIQGTETNPVIMASANGAPGDWGGLTICGKATTTEGANAEAEVGGFVYGGTTDNDNSGSIKYLVIKGTGAQISEESQYNGISFYAVGSGTTVENVAIFNGSDDGVEFFGGTVNAKNIYLENLEDDAVDWTEGWSGSVENVYISHREEGFSTAFEADGANNNPKFKNVTAVCTAADGGTALQFKKQSGATIENLYLSGYTENIDMKDAGPLANVIIEGSAATANGTYKGTMVSLTSFDWAGVVADENSLLAGDITDKKTLDASIEYRLTGALIVEEGGELVIPAGTKIVAEDKGTDIYIAVMMGGKIDIQGTADAPVIMTSINAEPGDWGGLTICGKATTTEGSNAEAEVGGFVYGGTTDDDNSGSIKYLVIKGTGAQINEESQYNGISFYAVGSGTTVENVAVFNGSDDGVEFFGGSVNAKNIYLENLEDDAVDWTEGWNGSVENTYILHSVDGFSTAFEADGENNNPTFTNVTAICTAAEGGTALQFKKASGATITNLTLEGYTTNVEIKDADQGKLEYIQIEGADATADGTYTGTKVDVTIFDWAK